VFSVENHEISACDGRLSWSGTHAALWATGGIAWLTGSSWGLMGVTQEETNTAITIRDKIRVNIAAYNILISFFTGVTRIIPEHKTFLTRSALATLAIFIGYMLCLEVIIQTKFDGKLKQGVRLD
jgi:hypothetical protein